MCVTANPAKINSTRTFVYATHLDPEKTRPVHISGYQNRAETVGSNCMFLNFAGRNLALVRGPEQTSHFMRDMTSGLPELVPVMRTRGGGMFFAGASRGVTVEEYGDYTVILAQGPADILSALNQVSERRRPSWTPKLQAMVDFYMSYYPEDTFVLGCFDGKVKPKHPITVSYEPRDPTVLTIPGLDAHDGEVPDIGAPVHRDFRLAFGIAGQKLPHAVYYDDHVDALWAPASVAGFVDNRRAGRNGDYIVPVNAVMERMTGRDLAVVAGLI